MFCTLPSKGGRKEVCPVKLKNHSFCPPRNFDNNFKNTPSKRLQTQRKDLLFFQNIFTDNFFVVSYSRRSHGFLTSVCCPLFFLGVMFPLYYPPFFLLSFYHISSIFLLRHFLPNFIFTSIVLLFLSLCRFSFPSPPPLSLPFFWEFLSQCLFFRPTSRFKPLPFSHWV